MRILMIAQSNFTHDGRIIRLSSVLINHNINVDLICLRYEHESEYEEINGVRFFRIMKNYPKNSVFLYLITSLIFLIKASIKATFLALKNSYELVHIHNMPDYLVFAVLYLKLKNVPIVLDLHDLPVELFKDKWKNRGFNQIKYILRFIENVSCSFADYILTVTKECVDILIKQGINPNKISLIMNSADDNLFRYTDERFKRNEINGFKFLYHGTIERRFGLHYFLNTMPQILRVVPNAEFHLFGSYNNEYSDELRYLIKTLNIEKFVFFNEAVPYIQVNEMIKDFDMGVVTYEQTDYMNLALPTKAVEYALTGLPFIISDLISVRTIFREMSVCYVEPENSESIIEKVYNLYKNCRLREEMAKLAYEDILKFSWNVMSARYLTIINKLIVDRK